MSNYKISEISKDDVVLTSDDNARLVFMNSMDSRFQLKTLLDDDNYSKLNNIWGSTVTIETVPLDNPEEISELKESKIKEMSNTCHEVITNGFDIELNNEKCHFSLKIEDQLMIQALMLKVKSGETSNLPYHADGQLCRQFTPEEITLLYTNMESIITYNTTYFNSLKNYINNSNELCVLNSITWGIEIPDRYQSNILQQISEVSESEDTVSE